MVSRAHLRFLGAPPPLSGVKISMPNRRKEALDYHTQGRPGKIEVVATKSVVTQRDLSLAYSPGVAEPCREIEANPDHVFKYTTRGNLVAVVSNGTAVLGLGNIGPLAAKPVMEGKGFLFKRFAGIDVFDIEVDSEDPRKSSASVSCWSLRSGASISRTSRLRSASSSSAHSRRRWAYRSSTSSARLLGPGSGESGYGRLGRLAGQNEADLARLPRTNVVRGVRFWERNSTGE